MDVLDAGQKLGSFVLGERIAHGGMAEIWSATDETDQVCALKILLPILSGDDELRTMFLDEVQIATRLRHPNIVRVMGVHEEGAWLFQSMELLDGQDVRRLLSKSVAAGERIPIAIAVTIARDVARGLAYAHGLRSPDGKAYEIVHRDVSPHNIIVTRDGLVKVVDFGIARAQERLTKTRPGLIKGKIAYMSPEQALGQVVDVTTDVFALGVVVWEMLAMRRLFVGENDAEILGSVCEADVPPVREQNPDVSPALADLVESMLAQRPRWRPESMAVVDARMNRILHQFDDGPLDRDRLATWAHPRIGRKSTKLMPPSGPSEVSTSDHAAPPRTEPTDSGASEPAQALEATVGPGLATDAVDVYASVSQSDERHPSDPAEIRATIQDEDETDGVPVVDRATIQDPIEVIGLETIQDDPGPEPPTDLAAPLVSELSGESVDPLGATRPYSVDKQREVAPTEAVDVRGEAHRLPPARVSPPRPPIGAPSAATRPAPPLLSPAVRRPSTLWLVGLLAVVVIAGLWLLGRLG